jgi:protease secretion system outer membrane protein
MKGFISMKKLFARIMLVAVQFAVVWPVHGEPVDLVSAYQKAITYDAQLRTAKADNMIYREEIGKARASLRPIIRWSAARGRSSTQHGYMGKYAPVDYYNTVNNGVSVRQSLFNWPNIAEYKQAKAMVAKSDAELQKEELNLIVRITEVYCNALYAEDNLSFSTMHTRATEEQFRQAERRFEKGFGTITEINESKASYDLARAEAVEVVNSVEYQRRELEDFTGVYPDELCKLSPEKLKLNPPDPKSVEHWIEAALSNNFQLAAARQEIQVARREVEKQRSARYPTLDLVGGRNYSESENNYSIGSTYDTYSVSLQLNLPIYTGGYTSASIRQAKAKLLRAQEQLSSQERGVESEVRKQYNSVISTIAQIRAYEQAVKSGEIAFIGTKKGFDAGMRSNMDVLNAEYKLLSSRRDLAKSRYQYILNQLVLKQSAGTLAQRDVDEVNGWLTAVKK